MWRQMVIFVLFHCVLTVFDCFWRLIHCWYTVGTFLVDMWRLVHQCSFLLFWLSFDCLRLFLTIGTPLEHCWYSLGRPVTIGTPMVLSVFDDWYSVPFLTIGTVYHSSKTVKRQSKQQKSPLVYQSSPVYQDCTNTPTVYQSLCCSNQIVRLSRATNTVIYVVTKVWKAGTLAERNVRLSNLLISSCLVILC